MELNPAIILAGPLGYFVAQRRWSIALYLVAWRLNRLGTTLAERRA